MASGPIITRGVSARGVPVRGLTVDIVKRTIRYVLHSSFITFIHHKMPHRKVPVTSRRQVVKVIALIDEFPEGDLIV